MSEAEQGKKDSREYTGLSTSYYKVRIGNPTSVVDCYTAECNDIIEALGMNYAEGNAFKAIWRVCAARQGKSKRGYDDPVYDAEKVVFFGQRMVEQLKNAKQKTLAVEGLTQHSNGLSTGNAHELSNTANLRGTRKPEC